MDDLFFGLIVLIIGIVFLFSVFRPFTNLYKRVDINKQTAKALGASYRTQNQALVEGVQHLMRRRAPGGRLLKLETPQIFNALYFEQSGRQIIWAEFSDKINARRVPSPYGRTRLYQTIIIIPLTPDDGVPLFEIRRKELADAFGQFPKNKVRVTSPQLASLQRYQSLLTEPKLAQDVQYFFETRPRLVSICTRHRNYRLVSDGRWLIFHEPEVYLASTIEHVNYHIKIGDEILRQINRPESHLKGGIH